MTMTMPSSDQDHPLEQAPPQPRRGRATLAVAALACLGLATACNQVPHQPGRHVERLIDSELLEELNPNDIAVVPVIDAGGNENLPAAQIREAFYEGLVRRGYSPLSLAYVDGRAVEASWSPGQFEEEAVMEISVELWDESRWGDRAELRVAADVWILAGNGAHAGEALWGGRVERQITLKHDRTRIATDHALRQRAIDRFADEVLGALPRRDPLAR